MIFLLIYNYEKMHAVEFIKFDKCIILIYLKLVLLVTQAMLVNRDH